MNANDITTRDGLPAVYAKDRNAWRRWLARNHAKSRGVWLVYYKRGSGRPTVSYAEAVEECLCYGWIDSVINAIDADRYMQLMTPRKPKSAWSKVNKGRIERMVAEDRMTPAGLAKIEQAKTDGSWTRLDSVEAMTLPPELRKALAANRTAKRNFDAWPQSARKQVLYYLNAAKRPETRARRIDEIIRNLAANIRPSDARWRGP